MTDVALNLPTFESGNHPINGMNYYQTADGREFLLMAARNDETLWVVDLSGQKENYYFAYRFFLLKFILAVKDVKTMKSWTTLL